jgi:hypothetical protein
VPAVAPPRAEPVTTNVALIPAGHCFNVTEITLSVAWVLIARVSLRGVGRVLRCLRTLHVGVDLFASIPHATTVRWWLLRLGHYKLHRPKEIADDWVWIADHSNQFGQEKCLVILGIRLSRWQELRAEAACREPAPDAADSLSSLAGLRLEDMEIIDLQPVTESNKQVVYRQLEANVAKTGVPRAIIDDHGGDLAGGVALFRQQYPQTIELYDVTHKAACLLKARLQANPRWKQFAAKVGQTKCQLQQTELAMLIPPSQRVKARYMNLETLIAWGGKTLALVEQPTPELLRHCTAERLEEKLGWLREYRAELVQWSQMEEVIQTTLRFVRREGYYVGAELDLKPRLPTLPLEPDAALLRDQLVTFVADQSRQARPGERLPGSSEVIEACFGKFKSLERDQVHGGFTGLLLGLAANVSDTTQEVVAQALAACKTCDVGTWIKEKLGTTLGSKRRTVYQSHHDQGATKPEGTPLIAAA